MYQDEENIKIHCSFSLHSIPTQLIGERIKSEIIKDISACAICWENIILHSHPEMEISFKFIPKILMSKECIHFFGPLCILLFLRSRAGIYSCNLIFVVPCIMLNSEINPTRCNNCVYSSQWLYFTCFGWQFHPSSGVYMLYMASGRQVYLCCNFFLSIMVVLSL